MKYYQIITIVSYFSCFCYGQNIEHSRCDSIGYFQTHYYPFDKKGINTTKDYILKYHSPFKNYISNRESLSKIPLLINYGNQLLFKKDSLSVEFIFKTIHFNSIQQCLESIEEYDVFFSFKNTKSYAYGISVHDTSELFVIDSVYINNNAVPPLAFSDLFQVNRNNLLISIKPIECYFSENQKYIYLYIMGLSNEQNIALNDIIKKSYIAKLIFEKDGRYIGRIVETGVNLEYFGFGWCMNFKGF